MQLVSGDPHPLLRPYVTSYQGYRDASSVIQRDVHAAFPGAPLIISFVPDPMITEPADGGSDPESHSSFVAGLHDTFSAGTWQGEQYGLQVNFTPVGAYLFLGLPMQEITNRIVEFGDLLGPDGDRLVEQLASTPEWTDRFAAVDAFVGGRIANARRRPAPGVVWSWRRITETGGRVTVSELATELGFSRKHLTTLFREQVGLPPKTVARIVRFDRASRALGDGKAWTDIADEAGYYDQAHLIRDFRQFSGFTPGEYAQRRSPEGGISGD